MYRIAVAALILATTGCATTGGGGSREGNATVAGIIRLTESGLAQAGNPCDQLKVVVAHPATPTDALGKAMVKSSSRGSRCSFTVSGIPSNTDLQVSTVADSGLKCDNGSAPTISEPAQVKMPNYGTGTRDFTVSCGA